MKDGSEKVRRANLRRFRANAKKMERETQSLITNARASQNDDQWPEYLIPELESDAWFNRMSRIADLIRDRGSFSSHVSTLAVTNTQWETKEAVATWLRKELRVLREAEKKAGSAPVRRGEALGRIEIADIAVEMLGCIGGQALTCLFLELLDVDRHRASLAEIFAQLERAAEWEAQSRLQGQSVGVRQMAKAFGVSPSTVTRWRRSKDFQRRVEMHQRIWDDVLRTDYFKQIKMEIPEANEAECFREAFRRYLLSIPKRRSGSFRPTI
jgi:hypothetical protein